jgi:cytochrome c551
MKINFTVLLLLVVLSSCDSAEEIKRKQYYAEGFELYKTHCANCHQLNGTGLEGLYPPISKEYLSKNKSKVICQIKYGGNDSLVINGKMYTQAMPGNIILEPLEIAEITTFIYNNWGDETVITKISEIETILNNCRNKAKN